MADKSTVSAVFYEEKNIGLWMKKYAKLTFRSKKHYVWKISLDSQIHSIEFVDSILSGKKKIIKDGLTVFE